MHIAAVILSALLAAAFLGSGGVKLVGAKQSLQIRDELRIDSRLWTALGGLEVVAAIGLLVGLVVPYLGIAAAAGLALLMVGAIGAHARAHDLRHGAPAALLMILAVALIVVRFLGK